MYAILLDYIYTFHEYYIYFVENSIMTKCLANSYKK